MRQAALTAVGIFCTPHDLVAFPELWNNLGAYTLMAKNYKQMDPKIIPKIAEGNEAALRASEEDSVRILF